MLPKERSETLLGLIGEEICHLRLALGMTQSALGTAVGVTQRQIQQYEAGQSSMSVNCLAAIADALGIKPGHLFGQGRSTRGLELPSFNYGDPTIGFVGKEDLALAAKIALIRSDAERRDILISIEQTVELLARC